jgi:hypothetical protein
VGAGSHTGYSALDHGIQGVNDWARKRAGKVRRATKKPHLAKERGGLEEGRGARDNGYGFGRDADVCVYERGIKRSLPARNFTGWYSRYCNDPMVAGRVDKRCATKHDPERKRRVDWRDEWLHVMEVAGLEGISMQVYTKEG